MAHGAWPEGLDRVGAMASNKPKVVQTRFEDAKKIKINQDGTLTASNVKRVVVTEASNDEAARLLGDAGKPVTVR